MIRGTFENPKDGFLVVEKTFLAKIPSIMDVPLILLAAFYIFDMQYTIGLTNLYTFLEYYLLGKKIPKGKTRIAHLVSKLHHLI